MEQTLVVVGGFLGAGKTTLLMAAAERLRAAGRRVGVITNDQGDELVDTQLARANGFATEEVSGGCLCCRFSDFIQATDRLEADVLFAEPVGSCTDIAATVLRPLQRLYRERFRLAPFTVLVDPQRASQLLAPEADPDLSYLFRKQLAEADLVRFAKADQYSEFPELPGVDARPLSAHTGEGISEWLEEVLEGGAACGVRPLEIDYERYGKAEAALGWLNWRAELRLQKALTPAAVIGPLLERLEASLTASGAEIVHLKLFGRAATGFVKASICHNGEEPYLDGALDALPALRHELVLNLRGKADPAMLESLVEEAVTGLPGRMTTRSCQAFRPAPPAPEHRLTEII